MYVTHAMLLVTSVGLGGYACPACAYVLVGPGSLGSKFDRTVPRFGNTDVVHATPKERLPMATATLRVCGHTRVIPLRVNVVRTSRDQRVVIDYAELVHHQAYIPLHCYGKYAHLF